MGQRFRPSAFNSLAEQIAIVDERGVIRDVNESWRRFARENGSAEQAENPIGVNYFEVCEQAVDQPDGEEAGAARSADGKRRLVAPDWDAAGTAQRGPLGVE